jgi:predicted nucleotide-binding protein
MTPKKRTESVDSRRRVFIVHGNDPAKTKTEVALLIQNLGLQHVILADEPGQGQGIMEKLERFTGVDYVVAILTADDVGAPKSDPKDLKPRARQNVIFELGFFIAALGRERHAVLYEDGVELPSNYRGMNYIELDPNGAWKTKLGRELDAAGFDVNLANIR